MTGADRSFRFAVVGDRTGGHRPGVFGSAIQGIERLRPDFVVSVGDLIEGHTTDAAVLDRQWDEVLSELDVLSMPYHLVPGNHDLSNPTMVADWHRRHGPTWRSFVHDDVLFLLLDTEDPPEELPPDILERTHALEQAMAEDAEATQARVLAAAAERDEPISLPGRAHFSEAQLDWVRGTLAAHADVRWTFVILHRPAWRYESEEFDQIAAWLADRDHTVIAGHEHYYTHERRDGRDYFDLGTCGGVWLRDGPGRIDHVLWVTMTGDGPVFANVTLDGLLGVDLT